jgi:F-type H+-transporting ATPase subunit a
MAGGAHYTYLDNLWPQIENGANLQKVSTALAVGAGLVLLGAVVSSRLRTTEGTEAAVIPNKKINLFGWCDFLMEVFVGYQDSLLGKAGRKFVPFTASIFFFIFGLNLLGLVPGMPAATTTVWLNVGMALVVFIHFNFHGMKSQGVGNYLKHYMGPLHKGGWILLGLFMFALEILSISMRVLTLNLRLYWNISADHIVLAEFTKLLSFDLPFPTFLPAIFYVLGVFVSFMQAFVFTTLTMVYILLATQHEEDH